MRLLKLLLDLYKDEYELNLKEGLIKTTNIGKTINILNRNFPGIEISKIDHKDNLSFKILMGGKSTDISSLLKMTNNLGWFPSWIESPHYTGKYTNTFNIQSTTVISFEAKYDEKIEKHPRFLYHITSASNSDKILKKGLSPKSRSKASYHPDRVYLSGSKFRAESLADLFYQKTGEDIYDLLEIDTTLIPGDYLKLYKDPNFIHGEGYYTLNNIPPNSIKFVKKIFI